jgi:hypothetical protein
MSKTIERIDILNRAFGHFQQVTQWPDSATGIKYMSKADALIEVLEVIDCGSIGGFDKENPHKRVTGCNKFDRFLTVLAKYDDAKNITPICGADVKTLTTYFTQLMQLRDKVYAKKGVK